MHPALAPLFARRSVRAFTGEPVSDDLVTDLLEAAMAAPSARGADPWHFIVVRDPALLTAIAELLPYGKMLPRAGLGILVSGDLMAANRQSESYLLQDCSAAMENLLLAAGLLDLGAVWLGVHPTPERIDGIRRLCSLPETIVPVGMAAVGHPAQRPPPRTRYAAAKVHHDRW
jgi:nitroreductase